jgi:hypothetical protein
MSPINCRWARLHSEPIMLFHPWHLWAVWSDEMIPI